MDILESVIRDLTSDEVRRFKILSNRFKADEEKKLIILFDGIRSEQFDGREDGLIEELYEEVNPKTKNRFYRLRNKLLDNLEKSLVFYHFKYKDSIHAYYDIQLSILYRERGNYEVAQYFLKKAEKKAVALDQFNILELIYGEYVELALKNIKINIEPILERRKANFEKLRIHRKNTEAIAVITQKLKKSNFGKTQESVVTLLRGLRRRLEETSEIFNSPEGRILVFRTVSTLLLQKKAFGQLAEYLLEVIRDFEVNELFSNDNHSTRLLMRLWLCNALFKLRRFDEALEQIDILEKEMKMYSRQNYYTYLFNFYNVKINTLKSLGELQSAKGLLKEALSEKHVINKAGNQIFLNISKADLAFLSGNFKEALEVIREIKNAPEFLEMDEELLLYLSIFELVNLHDSGATTQVGKSFKKIRKAYKKLLKTEEHESTLRFLEIVNRAADAAEEGRKMSWGQAAKSFSGYESDFEVGGNQIFLYDLWIRSHRDEKPYLELFLKEMGN